METKEQQGVHSLFVKLVVVLIKASQSLLFEVFYTIVFFGGNPNQSVLISNQHISDCTDYKVCCDI